MAFNEPLAIPQHTYKVSHDDNDRIRLLKDVLRTSVALQENEGKKQSRKVQLSGGPMPAKRKDRTKKLGNAPLNMKELSNCEEHDRLLLDMAGHHHDESPLLKTCGSRVSQLAAQLQVADEKLKTLTLTRRGLPSPTQQSPAEHQQKSRDLGATLGATAMDGDVALAGGSSSSSAAVDPIGEIRIMDRPKEDPKLIGARNDRVVYDFIAKHARFHRLEDLRDGVENAEGYDGLRQLIPKKNTYHPNLVLLDDKVLEDPERLRRAVHAPAPSQLESRRTQGKFISPMRARLRSDLQVDVTSSLSRSRGNRQGRSAPELVRSGAP